MMCICGVYGFFLFAFQIRNIVFFRKLYILHKKKTTSVVISFYHLPLPNSVDVYFCGCCDCQLAGSLYSIVTMVALPIHFDDTVCDVNVILNHLRMKKCDLNCRRIHKFGSLLGSALFVVVFFSFFPVDLCEDTKTFLTGYYTHRCLDCGQKWEKVLFAVSPTSVWHTVLSSNFFLPAYICHTIPVLPTAQHWTVRRISMRTSELSN